MKDKSSNIVKLSKLEKRKLILASMEESLKQNGRVPQSSSVRSHANSFSSQSNSVSPGVVENTTPPITSVNLSNQEFRKLTDIPASFPDYNHQSPQHYLDELAAQFYSEKTGKDKESILKEIDTLRDTIYRSLQEDEVARTMRIYPNFEIIDFGTGFYRKDGSILGFLPKSAPRPLKTRITGIFRLVADSRYAQPIDPVSFFNITSQLFEGLDLNSEVLQRRYNEIMKEHPRLTEAKYRYACKTYRYETLSAGQRLMPKFFPTANNLINYLPKERKK